MRGVEFLKQFPPQKGYFDTYYYHSTTHVMAVQGDDVWSKFWKPKMRDLLLEFQTKSGDDATNGSWPKDQGFIGSACGQLGTTSFAILILETICGYAQKRARNYSFPVKSD